MSREYEELMRPWSLRRRLRAGWKAMSELHELAQRPGRCCDHCWGWHLDARYGSREGPCAYPGCGCERFVVWESNPDEHQEIYNDVLNRSGI